MRKSSGMTLILAALCIAACAHEERAPVVSAPEVTSQPQPAQRNWVGRQADAVWDVANEPAGWFKPAPKPQPAKTAAPATEPSGPVEVLIIPRTPPGVIVTDEPTTQP